MNSAKTIVIACPTGKTGAITVPSGVTSFGSNAFFGCTGLTSIDIPSGVTSIGFGVFQRCTGLTSIDIPSTVTSIGANTFRGCTGLTSIDIPSGITSIGFGAFQNCTGLTSVTVTGSTPAGYLTGGDNLGKWMLIGMDEGRLTKITISSSGSVDLAAVCGYAGAYGKTLVLSAEAGNTTGGTLYGDGGGVLTGADRAGKTYRHDGSHWMVQTVPSPPPTSTHKVSLSGGIGYTVSCSAGTSFTVTGSDSIVFSINVLPGYSLTDVDASDATVKYLGGSQYSISGVSKDTSVSVICTPVDDPPEDDGTATLAMLSVVGASISLIIVCLVLYGRKW